VFSILPVSSIFNYWLVVYRTVGQFQKDNDSGSALEIDDTVCRKLRKVFPVYVSILYRYN